MFESAIEKVLRFTRPLHNISRTYGGMLLPGTATLFFVNEEGVAVTCKHVVNLIPAAERLNQFFLRFKTERDRLSIHDDYDEKIRALESKYNYKDETTIQLKNNFLNCFDKFDQIVCHTHPSLDLAILEFKGFGKTLYNSHATFVSKNEPIKQGKYLCRVGYPFPEFDNFRLNMDTDDIEWISTGNPNSPSFPIDGIVTRFVGDPKGKAIIGIEMSTPGLRGQSGGPLFDVNGVIYGMQSATHHLHLGFDIEEREIIQAGKRSKVSNFPFLHVGVCVHAERIKEFLAQHQIRFYESE